MKRARRRDRLALAAERRAGRQVAGEQAALAQLGDRARVPAGQRAALGLHVAEARAAARLREGPGDRGELTVQREHRDGALERQLAGCSSSTGSTACCRLV